MPKFALAEKPSPLRLTTTADDDKLLDIWQAADILGIKKGTLHNWCSRGRIEYIRVGRLLKFSRAGLRRFMARNTAVPKE